MPAVNGPKVNLKIYPPNYLLNPSLYQRPPSSLLQGHPQQSIINTITFLSMSRFIQSHWTGKWQRKDLKPGWPWNTISLREEICSCPNCFGKEVPSSMCFQTESALSGGGLSWAHLSSQWPEEMQIHRNPLFSSCLSTPHTSGGVPRKGPDDNIWLTVFV